MHEANGCNVLCFAKNDEKDDKSDKRTKGKENDRREENGYNVMCFAKSDEEEG